MAKATKVKNMGINVALLTAIADATKIGSFVFVSAADGSPLLELPTPLIEVNTGMIDPNDASKAAARITQAGLDFLANPAPAAAPVAPEPATGFEIVSGAVLPPSKRGNTGGGAPVKYPFDNLQIGQGFFVPKSVKHPDPVKTLGSTVSSANMRYAVETGELKTVNRTKRGEKNKAVLDAAGNKIKESVQVQVYKYDRKFSIRAMSAGQVYGNYTAPADGAFIMRIEVK